jgi:drug/metabolite transporter (DMT)-like permease
MVLYFGALSLMTINQAGAGLFAAPIFVLAISALFFGVAVGPVRILAVAIGFAGVLVVLQPWGTQISTPAMLVAISAGVLHATGAVMTRQLCAQESTATMNLGYFLGMGVWGILGVAVVSIFDLEQIAGAAGFFSRAAVWPSAEVTAWIAVQTLGGVVATGFLIRGYQMAEASRITVFDYSFLPFAALWAWLMFGDVPDMATVVGTGLIIVAGVAIVLRTEPPARTLPQPVPNAPLPPRKSGDQPGASR